MTFGSTLERMAHAFSRLEALDGGARAADAMRAPPGAHPRATGRADTELMRLGDGWVAKGGAEGAPLRGVADGLGIALKVEDGSAAPLASALAAFLAQARLRRPATSANVPVENSRGEVVGELRAALTRVNTLDLFPNRPVPV